MGYLIIHTNDKHLANILRSFINGKESSGMPDHKDLVVETLNLGSIKTNSDKSFIAVLRNNGIALSWIASVMQKYPDYLFHVFYSEWLNISDLPKFFQDAGKILSKPGKSLKSLPKALGMTKDELEAISLDDLRIKLKETIE